MGLCTQGCGWDVYCWDCWCNFMRWMHESVLFQTQTGHIFLVNCAPPFITKFSKHLFPWPVEKFCYQESAKNTTTTTNHSTILLLCSFFVSYCFSLFGSNGVVSAPPPRSTVWATWTRSSSQTGSSTSSPMLGSSPVQIRFLYPEKSPW